MDMNTGLLAWAALAWFVVSLVVTVTTWRLAAERVDAPGWVTASNATLCFFPPFNLMVLAYVATLDRRSGT